MEKKEEAAQKIDSLITQLLCAAVEFAKIITREENIFAKEDEVNAQILSTTLTAIIETMKMKMADAIAALIATKLGNNIYS